MNFFLRLEAAFHTHRFSRNAHLQALHAKTGPSTKWAARCLILFVQSTISTLTFWPVRWATDLMIVRISLAMRP